MADHPHKSSMDTQSRIHSLHIDVPLLPSGSVPLTPNMPKRFFRKLNPFLTSTLTHLMSCHLVRMSLSRTLNQRHGMSMASSLPLLHTADTSFVPSRAECWFVTAVSFVSKQLSQFMHQDHLYRHQSSKLLKSTPYRTQPPTTQCLEALDAKHADHFGSLRMTPGLNQDTVSQHTISKGEM